MSVDMSLFGAFFLTSSLVMVASGPSCQGGSTPLCVSASSTETSASQQDSLPIARPTRQQPQVISGDEASNLSCPELQVLDQALGVCVCSSQAASMCNSAQQLNPDTCQCSCVRVIVNAGLMTVTNKGTMKRRSTNTEQLTNSDTVNYEQLYMRYRAGRGHRKMTKSPPMQPGTKAMQPGTKAMQPGIKTMPTGTKTMPPGIKTMPPGTKTELSAPKPLPPVTNADPLLPPCHLTAPGGLQHPPPAPIIPGASSSRGPPPAPIIPGPPSTRRPPPAPIIPGPPSTRRPPPAPIIPGPPPPALKGPSPLGLPPPPAPTIPGPPSPVGPLGVPGNLQCPPLAPIIPRPPSPKGPLSLPPPPAPITQPSPDPTASLPAVPTTVPPAALQCPMGQVLNPNSCQCYVPGI